MRINRVVVVGDGVAAWLTAATLARTLNKVTNNIQVVSVLDASATLLDDSLGVAVDADSSLPSMSRFHHFAGFDENALLSATQGGFSLGVAIDNWIPGGTIFNPFGEVGASLGPVSFHHVVLKLRDIGQSVKWANYSMAALCAQAGRLSKPAMNDHSILSSLEYGFQFGLATYTEWLRKDAVAHGVSQTGSKFQQAVIDEAGNVAHVIAEDGQKISGELFIDCSGPSRRLASQVHEGQFVDWSRWLPCDRVSGSIGGTSDSSQPYALLSARSEGWLRTLSLPGRRSELRCVSSAHNHNVESGAHTFSSGYHPSSWQRNCVALGGAAAIIDPVSSLQLHLLHSGIERLVTLLPDSVYCVQEAIEFNRQSAAELECARDYAIALYKLNGRRGESFWDACRNMSVPDSLAHRLAVYESSGRIVMHDGEVVERMNWAVLFDAHGIRPTTYDVVARGIPLSMINEHLTKIREAMLAKLQQLPLYQTYLAQLR